MNRFSEIQIILCFHYLVDDFSHYVVNYEHCWISSIDLQLISASDRVHSPPHPTRLKVLKRDWLALKLFTTVGVSQKPACLLQL